MGPDRWSELRTPLPAWRGIAVLPGALAARAAARGLARWRHVRYPPRHLHRRLVLHSHAAPAGIVHDRANGHHDHGARVVTHPAPPRRRRLLRPCAGVA